MEATVYNAKGQKGKEITLPENIFGLPWNADLVHQVALAMAANARTPVAHTKTRGEIRGGGAKPWRQKGTGRARHGSTRSPIWVGGGVAHGPRNDKNYSQKINRKMKTKALFTVLSRKFRDGEVFFVDSLSVAEGRTAAGLDALSALKGVENFPSVTRAKKNSLYIALPEKNIDTVRGLRNVASLAVQEARNMNPLDLLQYKAVLVVDPEKAFEVLGAKRGASAKKSEAKTAKKAAPRKAASKKAA